MTRGTVASASTLPELLRLRSEATPDAEALRFDGRSFSFAELAGRARHLASGLAARGVGPGDRVALMLPNGLDVPTAWLAAPLLGAMAVPIHASYREADLGHVLRHSGARILLVGEEEDALARRLAPTCPELDRVERVEDAVGGTPVAWPAEQDPGRPVTIQYTSGTTGLPKGCVLDHRYWLTIAHAFQRELSLGPGDVALTAQRQSYMDPSWCLVLALLSGTPLVVLERFSASGFWPSVREHGVTFFYCIGTMPLYLWRQPADPVKDRDHAVRAVYCSGIPPELHAAFEERWGCPWREAYGSTELGGVLLASLADTASVGTGAMGSPLPGCRVRITDEEGRDLPDGEAGELLVQGQALMQRYHDDTEATRAWMPDGWARTGDLVVREGTSYRLVGRKRDVIRRSGENVSAAEVEAALASHARVRAAACIAVPDADRGEEVKAYVQLVAGGSGTEEAPASAPGEPAGRRASAGGGAGRPTGRVTPAELHAFLAERLAAFKVPRFIEIVDTFPLTASEKIAKAELVRSREDHRAGAWDAEAAS